MFPHDKLDWNLSRLEQRLAESPDPLARIAYAKACLSKGRFHAGGDGWFNEALTQARRVLHREAEDADALAIAGLSLVLLDRAEAAHRYLDDAARLEGEHPFVLMALGEAAIQAHDPERATECFEALCRVSPESWEAHMLLGRLLARRAHAVADDPDVEQGRTPAAQAARRMVLRYVEHAQFHLVRALQLGPSPHEAASLTRDLAVLCLDADRTADGQRLLMRLLDEPRYRAEARYHLGRVAASTGKHKKAVLYFRQHLDERGEPSAEVWARIGASYLHLREPGHAREACHRALAIDPGDLEARWILGSALILEGESDEAVRVFRELLELAPDHHDAFAEIVRLRTQADDVRWLRQALRSEAAVYDRLPVRAERPDPRRRHLVEIAPRQCTRARIDVVLQGLGRADPDVAEAVLGCLDLTTDEGLRFRLWEGVLELLAARRAGQVADQLAEPGRHYGSAAGRDVLTLAHLLPEDKLVQGLGVREEDLRQAAVERHGPAEGVVSHRRNIDRERAEARAWQALILLAIASRRSASARNLLVRWASDADEELAVAARAGLALTGDEDATTTFLALSDEHGLGHLAEQATSSTAPRQGPEPARLVTDRDDLRCATCGRSGGQVSHMITGHGLAVCNVCLGTVHERRSELRSRDPDVRCALTGATLLDTAALYLYQGVPLSSDVVEQSLGHEEREAIASYLAAL